MFRCVFRLKKRFFFKKVTLFLFLEDFFMHTTRLHSNQGRFLEQAGWQKFNRTPQKNVKNIIFFED